MFRPRTRKKCAVSCVSKNAKQRKYHITIPALKLIPSFTPAGFLRGIRVSTSAMPSQRLSGMARCNYKWPNIETRYNLSFGAYLVAWIEHKWEQIRGVN